MPVKDACPNCGARIEEKDRWGACKKCGAWQKRFAPETQSA
ncbi:hypothetical protein ACFOSC_27810 [Streptantibioticus rubrisoli]|nr:hypothetical protein [Streptantibioticus rubrisoli]